MFHEASRAIASYTVMGFITGDFLAHTALSFVLCFIIRKAFKLNLEITIYLLFVCFFAKEYYDSYGIIYGKNEFICDMSANILGTIMALTLLRYFENKQKTQFTEISENKEAA